MVLIYVPVVKGYDIFADCFCHLKIYTLMSLTRQKAHVTLNLTLINFSLCFSYYSQSLNLVKILLRLLFSV